MARQKFELLKLSALNDIRRDITSSVAGFRDTAIAAAKAANIDHYEQKFSDANSNLSTYKVGDVVAVQQDETRGMRFAVYVVGDNRKLVLLYFPLDFQRDDVVELRHYLSDSQKNVRVSVKVTQTEIDYGFARQEFYTLESGDDCRAVFEQALHDAQKAGKLLDVSGLSLYLTGSSIKPLSMSGGIVATGAPAHIYCDDWDSKAAYSAQGVNIGCVFHWRSEETDGDLSSDWRLKNVNFYNLDQSKMSKVTGSDGTMRDLLVEDVWCYGFSSFCSAGWTVSRPKDDPNASSPNGGYYADPGMRHIFGSNIGIVCDDHGTGGHAKLFDIHGSQSFYLDGPVVESPLANGYGIRICGSESVDNVPYVGGSASNSRIVGYKCTVKADSYWYNQIAKCTNVTLTGGTYHSTGFRAHNAWDMFDCVGVAFTGNTVWHSGACFFGHADLNNGGHASMLVGAHGFTATGNTIINPEHDSVFNLGGDGSAGGNRQGYASLISDNVVVDMPGFQAMFKQKYLDAGKTADDYNKLHREFAYLFIHDGCSIQNNLVLGVETFYHSYYSSAFIHGNQWQPNPNKDATEWNWEEGNSPKKPDVSYTFSYYPGTIKSTFRSRGAYMDLDSVYRMKSEPFSDATKGIGYGQHASVTFDKKLSGRNLFKVTILGVFSDNSTGYDVFYLGVADGGGINVRHAEGTNIGFEVTGNKDAGQITVKATTDATLGWNASVAQVM